MVLYREYRLAVCFSSEFVASAQNICGRSMYNDFLVGNERHSHVKTVVRFHLIVHLSGQGGGMIRATAAVTVRHSHDGAPAGNAVLHH